MRFVKVAVVSSMLALVMTVSAQAPQYMRALIPFKFTAGDQLLPAGEYVMKVDQARQLLVVYRDNGKTLSYVPLAAQSRFDSNGKAVFVFNTYGRAHFLRTVEGAGNVEGWDLFQSGAEREVAKTIVKNTTQVAWSR
jgi:hypothetical protein